MSKTCHIFILLAFFYNPFAADIVTAQTKAISPYFYTDSLKADKEQQLFEDLNLGKLGLGRRAYDYAMLGYNVLKQKGKLSNEKILTIIDFSLPSNKKRLFVIDVKNSKLLFVDYVAHGRNSGLHKAMFFSNEPESFKSSLGFYTTLGTYTGAHGHSMRLEGHEIGFNNNAFKRDIVMHSAAYVNESVVKSQGYLGRSLGCPALSISNYKAVIEKIKNGSCMFVYGNDFSYIKNSKMIKRPATLEGRTYTNSN